MSFVIILRACAVEMRYRVDNQRVSLTLGMYKQFKATDEEVRDLADFMSTWWYNNGRTLMGSHVSLQEVYVRELSSEDGYSYSSTIHQNAQGSLTVGTAWPNNVALCVSFRTNLRGRSNRGRNYWFGFGISQRQGANTVTSTYRNNVIAFYQRLLPGGSSDPTPWRWVVLSRQQDGEEEGRAVPIETVLCVDDVLDSARRRLPGRGL